MRQFSKILAVMLAFGATSVSAQEAEPTVETGPEAAGGEAPQKASVPQCKPDVGCVTNLPLPRYVSLKGSEGNARRGPGLTHRIDWVFTRAGMPLMITAEYENWRRVEDHEGAGGWVHYSLLSGVRTALVTLDMAEFRDAPSETAPVVAQAEMGVIGRVQECNLDWCRVALDGQRGWVLKSAIWGVKPDEKVD